VETGMIVSQSTKSSKVDPAFECCLVQNNMVRWYDLGDDDVIARDTGIGVIVEVLTHSWPPDYETYRVLCGDESIRIFARRHLKFLL
jgi:hypothetical protein